METRFNDVAFLRFFGSYLQRPVPEKQRLKMLGQRLYTLRKEFEYTKTHVSKAVSCCKSDYAEYEKGYKEPSIEILVRLSFLYNTTLDYLACVNGCEDY